MTIIITQDDPGLQKALDRFAPNARVCALEPMVGGVSADVFRLDLAFADGSTQSVVLRCHGDTHYGHSAELEFELLKALDAAGVPVARPLCFGARDDVLPSPFVMIAFVDGTTEIDSSRVPQSVAKMANALVQIHQTDTACLPNLPHRVDPVPELLDFLPDRGEWQPLRDRLTALASAPYQGRPKLLHGDFWPSNLIWSGGDIAAVLDWEDAALGDPLSDVAGACLELMYLYGAQGMAQFKAAYATSHMTDANRFALWLAYVSAAALKYMGDWRLDPAREAHMRQVAQRALDEAMVEILVEAG